MKLYIVCSNINSIIIIHFFKMDLQSDSIISEDNVLNIEDLAESLTKPFWFKELSKELTAKCYDFLDEYYYNRKSATNISKNFVNFQKEQKFSCGIIKFGYLICFYKMARQDGRYSVPHKALEKVLRVKNVREGSGVMVFSIFTSGYPFYTKVNPDGTKEIVREFLNFDDDDESVCLKAYPDGSVKILKRNTKEENCIDYYMKKDGNGKLIYIKKSEAISTDKYCYIKVCIDKTVEIVDKLEKNKRQEYNYVKIDSAGMIKVLDGTYSCAYDCHYCPNFENMPRSYLPGEPSVDRAIQCNFEVFKMIFERAKQYIQQGHSIDKAEVIIQGGTWDTYSYEYRTEFVRDVYYTFNILMDYFFGRPVREPLSMEEEIKLNETASCRVIGLTPETRPDQINYKSIQFLRKIGATRVQLGIQHLDDNILRHVNRRCYTKDTIRAIRMLKDCGFKVDAHLMYDLSCPDEYKGKMPEIDRAMFEEFNTNPDFKIDQLKIYPCVVTPHTKIKEWYDEGKYKPYGEIKKMTLKERIAYRKLTPRQKLELRMENPLYKNIFIAYTTIHPSIRINRVFRDIPVNVICGGTTQSSFRSDLDNDLEVLGLLSNCIRYREVGNSRNKERIDIGKLSLKELEFKASKATEYFLTWESDDERPLLFSLLRQRLSSNSGRTDTGKIIFPELVDCALIREVHTYGKATPCKDNKIYYENNAIMFVQEENDKTQHKGLGKKLLKRAEEIARAKGYTKIAVIAGVGVREYYRKLGYSEDSELGCYQIKYLNEEPQHIINTNMNNKKKNKIQIGLCLRMFYVVLVVFISILLKYFL